MLRIMITKMKADVEGERKDRELTEDTLLTILEDTTALDLLTLSHNSTIKNDIYKPLSNRIAEDSRSSVLKTELTAGWHISNH